MSISARMLGRTVINGVANHGRLEMYRQNADVLDGVKWLATLDSRACPVCGVMDGKIWKPDDLTSVKVPPAHPNCRCVLIPYIDMGDDSQRPAEAENFDKLAEEAYEANPSTKKEWKDLSYDYRKQLRYDAIKQWEKEHPDQEAYRQVHGMTFTDYLKEQPPEFQREYLGATRYNYYREGKLSLDMMVNPDRGFRRNLRSLAEVIGEKISPAEMTTKQFFDFSDENADRYTETERNASLWYSEPKNAADFNTFDRTGTLPNGRTSDEFDEPVAALKTAIEKYALPEDTILFRGISDITKLFDGHIPYVGQEQKWKGFTSTTINKYIADNYSLFTKESGVVELHAPAGTHGIPMGTSKMSNVHRKDKEFLLERGTTVRVISVEKKTNGYYVIAEIIEG